MKINFSEKGFAALLVVIFITMMISLIVLGIFIFITGRKELDHDFIFAGQSYYLAESGVEDFLLRVKREGGYEDDYLSDLELGRFKVEKIDETDGEKRIVVTGDLFERFKKVELGYSEDFESVFLTHAAFLGPGGIEMDNNSMIEGDVFSAGDIIRTGGNPRIIGTATVSGETGNILGIRVEGDAIVSSCENATIENTLKSKTETGCSFGEYQELEDPVEVLPSVISGEIMESWKEEAASGDLYEGDYIASGGVHFFENKRIEGNLEVSGNADIFLKGIVQVAGDLNVEGGNNTVNLDPEYQSESGVLIVDGKIEVGDRDTISGTDHPDSYLVLVSLFESQSSADPAVVISDSPELDIVLAPDGWIVMRDSVYLRNIFGAGVRLEDGARVIYEEGMKNLRFRSGGEQEGGRVIRWFESE